MRAPLAVDLVAIVVGAFAASLAARRAGFDIAGLLFLAAVGGLGGAITRDLLLGTNPSVAFTSLWLLPAALATGALAATLGYRTDHLARRLPMLNVTLDATALALYPIIGADRALTHGLPPVSCVAIGVLAGTAGALVRE